MADYCVRRAWLTLGAMTMPLEDESAGYYCTQLDLGYPGVRDVVDNRPDQHGVDDQTRYFAARVISANITAQSPAASSVDEVAASFAPFMDVAQRPVLHWVLERPGNAERTLTMRASGYTWPIIGGRKRDIQLQWVSAGDPIARDPIVHEATAWAGTGVLGRVYDLVFPRVYPVGAGVAVAGRIEGDGDVPIQPYLRIFGPISAPRVTMHTALAPNVWTKINLTSRIDAGHFVGIDTVKHTVYLDDDPGKSLLASVDWANTVWPVLPNSPDYTVLELAGTGTTTSSQVVASWQDGYLS